MKQFGRHLILILALVCVCRIANAKTFEPNGDWWRTLPKDTKLVFVIGYVDGAFWVADKTRTGSPFSQNGLPPFAMRDYLDRFYENPSNRRILIRDVFEQLNAKER
jgi:hypothetical protein